jgi:hypothetical protein
MLRFIGQFLGTMSRPLAEAPSTRRFVQNLQSMSISILQPQAEAGESDVLADLDGMRDEEVAEVYKATVRESARSARR